MEAQHADGSVLVVQVQGGNKHGDGSRWMLRITVQPVQPQQPRPSLAEVLADAKLGQMHSGTESDQSEGPADDDMQ